MLISRKKYENKLCEMYRMGMQSLNEQAQGIHHMSSMLVDSLETVASNKNKKEMLEILECLLTEAYTLEKQSGRLVEITRYDEGE